MMTNILSYIARVGTGAYLIYLAWPPVVALWDKVLTGHPTPEEWMWVVFIVLFGVAIALALAAVALLFLFCLLYAVCNTLMNYMKLALRNAASLCYGR
ncbi:hypothetical protein [Pantoea ananatis]|uniref:hypothetical protein n=1 Tax=Pantoea ananas TaxID=553 RepID=UPI001B315502|nr:hypothetical protein [Pantoea ananatis]